MRIILVSLRAYICNINDTDIKLMRLFLIHNLREKYQFKKTIKKTKQNLTVYFSSVQFSRSVVSNSLWPHESQHARPPCPSPTPGVYQTHVHRVSDAIQPSHPVTPFSSCPQSLPASESFPMSQLFAWYGQSTGVSAPAAFLPKNTQGWSPLE